MACRAPTAETTAPSGSRSSRTATASTSPMDTGPCSAWGTTGRGCRVETTACRLWPSSSRGSAPWIRPRPPTRPGRPPPRRRSPWTRLESSLRSFTVPASTRDEPVALGLHGDPGCQTRFSFGPDPAHSDPRGEGEVTGKRCGRRGTGHNTSAVCAQENDTSSIIYNVVFCHFPFIEQTARDLVPPPQRERRGIKTR